MLDEPPSHSVALVFFLIALVQFFAGSFFAACKSSLFVVDRQDLPIVDDPSHPRRKRVLYKLLRRPARLLIGLTVGENANYFGTAALGTAAIAILLFPLSTADVVITIGFFVVLTLAILLIGKVHLMHYLGTAKFIEDWSPTLALMLVMQSPVSAIVEKLVFLLEKPEEYLERMGATELDIWNAQPEDSSELEEEEREMIRSIYEFGDTTAREIMTPRTDVQAIDARSPAKEVLEFIAGSNYSRFPVYEENLDEIIGVVHVKNVLSNIVQGKPESLSLRTIATAPYFVPETKKLDELLQEIKQNRKQMVIVVDEYGGMAGVVTLEDILEEIVGEIQDEYDNEAKQLINLSEGVFIMSARLGIEEMNEALGTEIEFEDFDTLGGLVLSNLGKVPVKGDLFEYAGWKFTVMNMQGNRIGMMRVEVSETHDGNLERAETNGVKVSVGDDAKHVKHKESGGGS